MAKVQVNRDGQAVHDGRTIQFPLSLAGAVVTVPDEEPDIAPMAPNRSASKGDWVNYAISVGADPKEAEAATKDDLIHTYGG